MSTETNWFHDLTTDEAKEERATLSQRLIAVLCALCLVVLLLVAATWPTGAHAEEARANNAEECFLLADYGVTTRAMVLAEVDLQKRLMTLDGMYQLDDRMRGLVKIVRQAADKSNRSANEFAGEVYQTCVTSAGDISGLLGPSS